MLITQTEGKFAIADDIIEDIRKEAIEGFAMWLSVQDDYKDKTVKYAMDEYLAEQEKQ